jgi:hypothetical protein
MEMVVRTTFRQWALPLLNECDAEANGNTFSLVHFFFFKQCWSWKSGPMLAKQVLYCLSHTHPYHGAFAWHPLCGTSP